MRKFPVVLTSSVRSMLVLSCLAAALTVPAAQAIVDTDNPVEGPAQSGPIPPLPVANPPAGGLPVDWPDPFTGALFVQEPSYSWAPNLSSPPVETLGGSCTNPLPASSDTIYRPALAAHLIEALDESEDSVDPLFATDLLGPIQGFLDVLAALPGSTAPTLSDLPDERVCLSYQPVYARWLASQHKPKLVTYHSNPVVFREARERGARLYCAARTAQFAQGDASHSMGERAGFSVNVLGQQVDFFVTEARFSLDGPERFTGLGANNGGQAFEIPMLLGTRITPIRGLPLPGFDEVRVPVSLVTADGELRNRAEPGLIVLKTEFGGKVLVVPGHRKTYQTATHVDLIRTGSVGTKLDGAKTELFRVGPLAVEIGFDISYLVGDLTPGNQRVLLAPGFPAARSGRLWVQPGSGRRNHDGRWRLVMPARGLFDLLGISAPTWFVDPDGVTDPFWREPVDVIFPPPLEVRLIQDDDHSLESETALTIAGSLGGELGGGFGPFHVSLTVTGTLTGSVKQAFVLRDALAAQDQGGAAMAPISGLAVRSRQEGGADLAPATGTLHFHLSLLWPFDDIDFDEELFSVDKVKLANYDTEDDLPLTNASDEYAFRLGTGADNGDTLEKPAVWSHFPSSTGEFASFPTDVAACLADPTENPPTPPPCEEVPPQGTVPSAELCVYGPANEMEGLLGASIPPHVCSNLPGFLGGLSVTPEVLECLETHFAFLCSPVSKQQPLSGNFSEVVSHVLRLEDPLDQAAFANVIDVCAHALGLSTNEQAEQLSQDLVATKACSADGTLLDGDDILAAVNPTQAPPVKPGPACN